jgi:amino acid adenylation domain-containing protein
MFFDHVLNPVLDGIRDYGDRAAFCINEKKYTYADFGGHIERIRLAVRGTVATGSNVGLVANDDIDTYAAIFALWAEGLAYVPLHPHQPADRSMEVIGQADIKVVISSLEKDIFPGVHMIHSSKTANVNAGGAGAPAAVTDDTLAYILFTSGSTGKPKGVPITRGNVGAFMKSFFKAGFVVTHEDRCLQCFDLTFDVSVQSFLTPLTRGACVYTIPHDQIKYSYVYGLMEDHQLTFSVMAPSMVRYLRPYFDEIHSTHMRYCIMTAEASPLELIREWSQCIPNAEIFDFYGPTEATIYCTYYKFDRENSKQLNGMLSIGKAMDGMTAIIVDEDRKIVPNGSKGELCIAGPQLTPGYWNNPEKNREAFFEMPLEGVATRFYKTGDLCYMDPDGDIMYSGRLDFQVKIQGYRIELGEIEHHARECVSGKNAIAVAFQNTTGNTEIALFVETAATDTGALGDYLKSKMPYYMVPTKIICHPEFPLNTNGKVDRNKLKVLIA